MSTIVRSSSNSRTGRGARQSQQPLTARALRVRNACVCHAAARLGLRAPTDAELRELPGDARLGEAVEWWRARAPGAVDIAESGTGVSLGLKTTLIMAITLFGLVFTCGQAQ
jgi:hypothetical protein